MSALVDTTIPRFVQRGCVQVTRDDRHLIQHRTEADLRDGLATLWWFYGADVRTEVKVPDCGRIDVLVDLISHQLVIEVKKSITTPTQARQAFQQAHAYVAYLSSTQDRLVTGVVTAAVYDEKAAGAARRAYTSIDGCAFAQAMGDPPLNVRRDHLAVAAARADRLRVLSELGRGAHGDLVNIFDGVRLEMLRAS